VTAQRRQFLAVAAIYFGFGVFFLERHWVKGNYKFEDEGRL
jgi:hypothetical protein